MIEELKNYYQKPSTNKIGFAKEAGTTTQEIGRIISGKQELTEKMKQKLIVKLESDFLAAKNLLNLLKG